MISFTCDYSEGAHPEILKRLSETNMEQQPGYGEDAFSASAKARIRQAVGRPEADVFLLVGGTQTNATVIDAMLRGYEGVVAVDTGHIAVHEAGAIEFGGHKVLTLPGARTKDGRPTGKMSAADIKALLDRNRGDEARDHMVFPGMVYISFPTEYGTIYSKSELSAIYGICQENGLPLFIDGARLGYGLACDEADVTLEELASLCDVFYIGGTKVGALCGEAVVFPRGNAPAHFFTTVKQHGALLAKGRLAGVQFDTLFDDGLYLKISHLATSQARQLKAIFRSHGIPLYIDSPTNQQFPILTPEQLTALQGQVAFEVWERLPDGRVVTRFATSWATPSAHLEKLETILSAL